MANELFFTGTGDALTIYAIIRRKSDAKVWSVANSAFETWANGSIGDYDTPLTTQGGDLYLGDFPSALTIGTRVLIQYYSQVGGLPAITDTIKLTVEGTWNGAEVASASSVSIDSRALTTLASVKRHLRITATTDDTLLTELINQVSDKIERITGRRFAAANYSEWADCDCDAAVTVRNRPIVRVNRVRSYPEDAISASYGGSGVEAAVIVTYDEEGQNGNVRLYSITAAGTETTTDLSMATYPTLSTLVTAMDAVSDWTVSRIATADAPSNSLLPMNGIDAKSGTAYLQWASSFESGYRVNHRQGAIVFGGMKEGMIQIQYRGGYETIPDDVARVCNELVAAAWHAGTVNPILQSESIPDYSRSLADTTKLNEAQQNILAAYQSVSVGGLV